MCLNDINDCRISCRFEIIDTLGTYSVRLGGVMPVLKMLGKAGKGGRWMQLGGRLLLLVLASVTLPLCWQVLPCPF